MKTVFTAKRLYTPLEEIPLPLLFAEDGRITQISSRSAQPVPPNSSLVDFGDAAIAPGFFDIHIHGGAGVDIMRDSHDDLSRLNKFLATHGVTGYLPTTVAAPLDQTCFALGRLADAIESAESSAPSGNAVQARPLGIHV